MIRLWIHRITINILSTAGSVAASTNQTHIIYRNLFVRNFWRIRRKSEPNFKNLCTGFCRLFSSGGRGYKIVYLENFWQKLFKDLLQIVSKFQEFLYRKYMSQNFLKVGASNQLAWKFLWTKKGEELTMLCSPHICAI